jgi:hypothetical protein
MSNYSTQQKEEIIIDYENVSYQHQTREFMKHLPTYTRDYIITLFPIASWIHRYNLMVIQDVCESCVCRN